jgi:peptidoglycan hydrolase-like protein with peptidoglycan-binding domain
LERTLALAAACTALAVLPGCGDDPVSADEQVRASIAAVRGVPQDGPILGGGDGPTPTLMVFSRLDDLRLADFVALALPRLAREQARLGRLRIRLQTLAGQPGAEEDGLRLARLAQAAGLQDHFWEFVGSVAARYPGVIDDEFTASTLGDVPALRRAELMRDAQTPRVQAAIERATGLARHLKLGRFGFVVERRDGSVEVLRARSSQQLLKDLASPSGRVSRRVAELPREATPTPRAKPAAGGTEHPFRYPLREGTTGLVVEELQRGLGVKVTGRYDGATLAAVRKVQRERGLDPDGVTGEQTWRAVFSAAAPQAER